MAADPQQPPTSVVRGPAFWARIAAIVVYVPAIVVVGISAASTPSGGPQPWYGTVGVLILIVLVLGGLLTDTRFMGTMGGIVRWNRMSGWQKALVGFFYFLGLLPLGIGVFFAVSLLRQRHPEAFAAGTTPSTGLASSGTGTNLANPIGERELPPDSLRDDRGSLVSTPGWAPTLPPIPTGPSFKATQTSAGERVLATTRERLGCAFWFGVVITLGVWLLALPWWANRSYTLTTHRVIVRRGLFWKSENSIPLRNVQDVRVTYGPLAGTVTVVSAGAAIIFPPVPVAAAREFADAYERVTRGPSDQ